MKRNLNRASLTLIVLFIMAFHKGFAEERKVFNIPQISGISVDGSPEDWGDHGFCVELLAAPDGQVHPTDDFDVMFRLGWSREGLLVLAFIQDDVPSEHPNLSRLWQRDCVELFVSEYVSSKNRHQLVIAPGADPNFMSVRQRIYDWRPDDLKTRELTAQVAARVQENGSVVEVLFPWDNIGPKPNLGKELGFQFIANDYDGAEDSNGPLRVAWYPAVGPGSPSNMYSLRLSDAPSESVVFRIHREVTQDQYLVSIVGTRKLIGEPVMLKGLNGTIAQSKLEDKDGRASRVFRLNSEVYLDSWPQMDVILGGRSVHMYQELPTLNTILTRYIDALGGQNSIASLSTRVCEGRSVDALSWQEPRIKSNALKAYAKIPDKWITIIQTAKGSEKTGFDGAVGWKLNPDRIERDDRAGRSWLGFLLNPQGCLHIKDYFPSLRLEGRTSYNGHEVYLVGISSSNPNRNRLSFDAETGLLVRIGMFLDIKDYREVDGVKCPFRIVESRKGGESYFAFDKIKHNIPIDDSRFRIPSHEHVFAEAFQGIEDTKVLPLLQCKGLTYTHEDMNVPVKDGRFIHDFIVEHKYKRGLEIGTFTGYSTLWMGLAFQKTRGELITIEIDPSYAQVARENFRKAGLDGVIDSRINDALEEIPLIEGKFDFVFIDAWKPDYLKYLNLLRDRVRPDGAIIAHNVTNYAQDMQDYLDAIKNDSDLETTFNERSAEGMSISVVKK